jgi:hypothetical protein
MRSLGPIVFVSRICIFPISRIEDPLSSVVRLSIGFCSDLLTRSSVYPTPCVAASGLADCYIPLCGLGHATI